MACNRCGAETEWSKQLTPPPGLKKKDGTAYDGWWADKGKPAQAHVCQEKGNTGRNDFSWSGDILIQNVIQHPSMDEAGNLVLQALERAEKQIDVVYQKNPPPPNVKGQIRNALMGHILQAQQNVILKEGLYRLEMLLVDIKNQSNK